jgi:hypothetical protein
MGSEAASFPHPLSKAPVTGHSHSHSHTSIDLSLALLLALAASTPWLREPPGCRDAHLLSVRGLGGVGEGVLKKAPIISHSVIKIVKVSQMALLVHDEP